MAAYALGRRFAGHAPTSLEDRAKLTLHLGHSMGADHRRMNNPRTFKPMNLQKFKEAVEQVAAEDNVPSLTFPAGEGDTAQLPSDKPRRPRAVRKATPAPITRVAVDLPNYLVEAIRKQAAEENVTKRFLYLKAFRAAGFTIQDVDMMEDGRRDA